MQAGRTVVSQNVSVDSEVATRRLSGARLRAVGGRKKTLARLLFDESLAELADELLLLDDEDVSAADAVAPRRNARIARVDDAELFLFLFSSCRHEKSSRAPRWAIETLEAQKFDCVLIVWTSGDFLDTQAQEQNLDAAVVFQVGQYRALR